MLSEVVQEQVEGGCVCEIENAGINEKEDEREREIKTQLISRILSHCHVF